MDFSVNYESSGAALTAANGKRSGKFRHVFGEAVKPKFHYKDCNKVMTTGESEYLSVNAKYFAYSQVGGGGQVCVRSVDDCGAASAELVSANNGKYPLLTIHKARVLDTEFSPFVDDVIATASEDCTVGITNVGGDRLMHGNIEKADVLLCGHGRKVGLVKFNPVANSIIASAAYDRTVKLWNINQAKCVATFDGIDDSIYSMEWNVDGSQLAITTKAKKMTLFDPRTAVSGNRGELRGITVEKILDGSKPSKLFWMPNLNWIGITGFKKNARRNLRFYDLKMLSAEAKPIFSLDLDSCSSVLIPRYDAENGLLYLTGKGSSTIMYGEIVNDSRKYYPLGKYTDREQAKGGAWLPKKECDVWKCEIARYLKVQQNNTIVPLSFVVPRKVGENVFQSDIYPECPAGKPVLSAQQWCNGRNALPIMKNMDPECMEEVNDVFKAMTSDCESENNNSFENTTEEQSSTDLITDLRAENALLKKRIEELEAQIQA